jgi:two-component system LytT family response regulator
MVKAIIVDDEIHAQTAIESVLKSQFSEIEILDKVGTVKEAVDSIRKNEPELLFLDIDLPDGKGFDILQQLDFKAYKVIFVTAYQEYAVQAIKFSAFDYILKPLNPVELINAVNNAFQECTEEQYKLKLDAFLNNFNNTIPGVKKLVLKTSDKIHILDVKDIIRCESENTYTTFYTNTGNKILVSKPIKKYEEMLCPIGFMRTHQSHLINLNYISYFDKQLGGAIVMSDNSNIPVSSQKRAVLMEYLDSL